MVAPNERTDAVKGSIAGVYPGAVIDNLENNRRFMVTEDGEFLSCPTRDGQKFLTIIDSNCIAHTCPQRIWIDCLACVYNLCWLCCR